MVNRGDRGDGLGFWMKVASLVLAIVIAVAGLANAYYATKAELTEVKTDVRATNKRVDEVRTDLHVIGSDIKTLLQRTDSR
jgi:hypothetical protein